VTTCTVVILSAYLAIRWLEDAIILIQDCFGIGWLHRTLYILQDYHPRVPEFVLFLLAPWLVSLILSERRMLRAATTSAGLFLFSVVMIVCEVGIPELGEIPAGVVNGLILIPIFSALYGSMTGWVWSITPRFACAPADAERSALAV
jgi:hypothetical protein